MTITSEDLSSARIIVDHAKLAEQLTVRVGSLEQARWEHGEVGAAVDELASFLDSALVPYLRAEEGVLYGAPAGTRQADGVLGSRRRMSSQQWLNEHDMLSQAASTFAQVRTPADEVSIAGNMQSVFDRHIAHEDAKVMSIARTAPGTAPPGNRHSRQDLAQPPAPGTGEAGLATCLENAIAYEHARIARQIASSAREIRDDPSGQTAVYERITAALSRHASVMALFVYPPADDVLPRSEHEVTSQLRAELRDSEHAMLRLEHILHGDALENPRRFTDLWAAVAPTGTAPARQPDDEPAERLAHGETVRAHPAAPGRPPLRPGRAAGRRGQRPDRPDTGRTGQQKHLDTPEAGMAIAERTAETTWEGPLASGGGTNRGTERGARRTGGHLGVAHRAPGREDQPGRPGRGPRPSSLPGTVTTSMPCLHSMALVATLRS